MHDQLTEQLPSQESHCSGSTGPTSPDGKSRSSMNRLTHGCRSERTVLPDEDPAEFESMVNDWFDEYGPTSPASVTLVGQTARAKWFLQRAEKKLEEIEWSLPENAFDWNEEHHNSFEKFSRYKVTRERSFLRFYKELEAYFGRVLRDVEAREKARARSAALQLKWLNKEQERTAEARKVEQVVQVEIHDGKCKTTFYPTNEQLIGEVAARPKPVLFFTRWIQFADGVPPEYDWSNPDEMQQITETTGVQKMTYKRWLKLIEEEKINGHIGPLNT
jgi:hypothetical protein